MAMDTRATTAATTATASFAAVAHYRPRRCPVPMLPIPPSLSSTSSPPTFWMQSPNQDRDQKMKQEEEEEAEKMLKMAASSKRTKRPRVDPNFVSGEQLEQAAAAADDNLMMPKLKKLKKAKKSQVVNVETKEKPKTKSKTKSSSSSSSSPAKKWSKAPKRRSGHGKAEHRGDKRSRRRGDDGGAAAAAIAATAATATATSAADQLMAVTTPAAAHDIDIAAAANNNDDNNYQVTVVETGETVILGLKCSEPGCEEMLPSRDQFNRHLLYRHNRFPYACLEAACGKEFKVMGELGPHVRDHHSDVHEWPCAQCSHRFPTHRGLRHHLWYYHLEGLFACPTAGCPYTAHLPIAIKQHRYRLHSPTYTCEHCRKQFKQRSNLVRHLRTHSGEKPYRCNFVPVMVAAAVLAGFRSAANGNSGGGGGGGGGNIGDSFEELSMVPLDLSISSSSTSSSSPFSSSSSERSSRSQVKIKDEDHEEVEEAEAAENDFGECSYSSEVRSHVHRHIRTRHLKALEQQQKVNKERGAGAAFTALAAIVALINEDLEKFVIEVEDKC